MKIELKADYRGVLTDERFYRAGVLEVDVDIPEDDAAALIHAGRAVEVQAIQAAAEDRPVKRGSKRKGEL